MPYRAARSPTTRQAQTKQQLLYEALRERILSGAYGPGFRIVIDSVAQEFGVSALPVREAIRRLEAEGLVMYRANAGAQVAPADPGLFEEYMSTLAVLEGYATALAAPLLTESDFAALAQCTDGMAAAMEQMDSLWFSARNREFHAVIYDRCPNRSLASMLAEIDVRLDAIRRTVFVHIPNRGPSSISEHRDLIAMLRRRASAKQIEAAARNHKLRTLESFRTWERKRDVRARDAAGLPAG